MEDDLKFSKMEEHLIGKQFQWMMTSVEDNFAATNQHNMLFNIFLLAQPQQASQQEPELGTAQP